VSELPPTEAGRAARWYSCCAMATTRDCSFSQERGEDGPLIPLRRWRTTDRVETACFSDGGRTTDEHVFGTWFWEYYLAGDLVSVDGLIAEVPGAVPLQAGRRVPSLRVLLADVGKTDLAPRFRRAADHNGWEDADHGSLRATAGRDVGGRVGG